MFARAVLAFGIENRVVVPDQAIVKQMGAGDYYVYVYEGGKVSYNKVQLGRRLGDEYEVISGVPTDAQVVVAGQKKLADGVEVEVVK
jgi:multidrug efflux pump subunit AcrA (membrane-fusion protein)